MTISTNTSLEKYTKTHFGKYLDDDTINEIVYNGSNVIWYQTNNGEWHSEVSQTFELEAALSFAQTAAAFKKDTLDQKKPILSCTLLTGERVQIVIPPACKMGTMSITIRKPSKTNVSIEDFANDGFFTEIVSKKDKNISPQDEELRDLYKACKYQEFLAKAVTYKKTIVIAGETGSGKTTLMKSLIEYIPLSERLITIEDVEEIKFFDHKNFVQLFYPSEAKSGDLVNSATLLKSCLRMKPDRILIAELRDGATYDFINVVSSGHGGSLTSCHAGSVSETFSRLALMTLQNEQGRNIPFEVITSMLKDVIDVVVHMHKISKKVDDQFISKRRISEIYFKGNSHEAH